MNKLVPVIVLLAGLHAYAQLPVSIETPQSKIAQFAQRTGTLINRQVTDIGVVRGLKVQVIVVSDMIAGGKASGVKIEPVAAETNPANRPTALLDPDEVDALIKSIEFLKSDIFNTYPDVYVDAFYTANDGFSIGAYFSEKQWRGSVRLNKYESAPPVYFRAPDDFNVLLDLLRQARTKIK